MLKGCLRAYNGVPVEVDPRGTPHKLVQQLAGFKELDFEIYDKKHILKVFCRKISVEEPTRTFYDPNRGMGSVRRSVERTFDGLKKKSIGTAKDMLKKVGLKSFQKWVENMVNTGVKQTPTEWPMEMRNVADVAAESALAAQDKLGNTKLAILHRALSFCRCVTGKPKQTGAVCVGFIGPGRKRMPVHDLVWFQCMGVRGNKWFCSACGQQYSCKEDAFVLGIQVSEDPRDSVWCIAVPPTGQSENILGYMRSTPLLSSTGTSIPAYLTRPWASK